MKKLKKLVGLKKTDFDLYMKNHEGILPIQIYVRPARLIPMLKIGDEMALTSIFLSSLKLVKEFRYNLFKEIKFPKGGKSFYYTELEFPDSKFENRRIDGLIINVSGGIIKDAVFLK
jgi:hypothetical protein